MFDVITAGSATVDIFAYTDKSSIIELRGKKKDEEFIAYPAGSKMLLKRLTFATGGGGTNTATCFSRLGLKTAYFGCVGRDDNGKKILRELKKEKVAFIGTKTGSMTNVSIILDSIEHDRTILTYKKASDEIRFKDAKEQKLKTKWLYFSSLTDDAYRTLEELAIFAEKNKIKIAFNPSSYLAEKGQKYLQKVLKRTNVLVLNREEAELIAGKGSEKELLKRLLITGPELVVITDGKKGAHAGNGKDYYYIKPNHQKVAETTGAGDAFAATVVAGIIRKKTLEQALKDAQANAESVIQQVGAKKGLLNWKDINRAANRIKITKEKL